MNLLKVLNGEPVESIDTGDHMFEKVGSNKWILGVGEVGGAWVMRAPDIHWSFFENGYNVEDLGIQGSEELDEGVYEITTRYSEHLDWETGVVDDWDFNIVKYKLLFQLPTENTQN